MLLFLVAFATTLDCNDSNINLKTLRMQYYQAVNNSEQTDLLLELLQSRNDNNPLTKAYIGSLVALKAKHNLNPFKKLEYLKQAETIMEEAVSLAPQDIEIRFLRFSYQYYVPRFLGFSNHLQQDKEVIINGLANHNYNSCDYKLVENVARFLTASGECSDVELDILSKIN